MKRTIDIFDNNILLTDSYKFSHFNQYPKGMTGMHSYLESRGGKFDEIVFFGLQYYIEHYLSVAPTREDVDQAAKLAALHGVPFNRDGWEYIADLGYFPVRITAKPEGALCRQLEPLITIESTDGNVPWIVNWLETLLLKVWYPITVATRSRDVRKTIENYLANTGGDLAGAQFMYHNFGDRGSSSVETAAIGGAAHLTQFMGTDNFNALRLIDEYYGSTSGNFYGFSIPATEHSTVTSWGKNYENEMIDHYIESNKGKPIIACVMDSYDIFRAVDYVTSGSRRTKIESAEYPTFVVRPDSGEPLDVIPKLLKIFEDNRVAFTKTSTGHKLFSKYRIIWGDGITPEQIRLILGHFAVHGYAAGNFAFGSGGDMMQNVSRDTLKFAFKCSAVLIDEVWRDVYKNPITDTGKVSKKGIQKVEGGQVVYDNGFWVGESRYAEPVDVYSWDDVRNNALAKKE